MSQTGPSLSFYVRVKIIKLMFKTLYVACRLKMFHCSIGIRLYASNCKMSETQGLLDLCSFSVMMSFLLHETLCCFLKWFCRCAWRSKYLHKFNPIKIFCVMSQETRCSFSGQMQWRHNVLHLHTLAPITHKGFTQPSYNYKGIVFFYLMAFGKTTYIFISLRNSLFDTNLQKCSDSTS